MSINSLVAVRGSPDPAPPLTAGLPTIGDMDRQAWRPSVGFLARSGDLRRARVRCVETLLDIELK